MKFSLKNVSLKKVFFALIGIFLVGLGVAFNNSSKLGNDPIGILYDGVRSSLALTPAQLGTASNFVNYGLIILLLFIGRKYVNIGTLIYILPYGLFVNIGNVLYSQLFASNTIVARWLSVVIGCLAIYIGVAIYIAVNIGLDPFTGFVMVLCDKVKKEYRIVKIVFDIFLIIIGVVLGGRIGIITVITALLAGPLIQYFSKLIAKYIKLD